MSKFRKYGDRIRVSLSFSKPSLTKQSFKDECDMNRILGRYKKNPQLWEIDAATRGKGIFGDFSDVKDYRSALDVVNDAAGMFFDLPSQLRKEFDNDPAQFLDFVQDPKNVDKLVEFGLAKIVEAPEAPNRQSGDVSKPAGGSAPKKAKNPPAASSDDAIGE